MKLSNIIDKLIYQHPYLKKYIKKWHQADVSNIYLLEHYFEYNGSLGIYKDSAK